MRIARIKRQSKEMGKNLGRERNFEEVCFKLGTGILVKTISHSIFIHLELCHTGFIASMQMWSMLHHLLSLLKIELG